MNFKRLPQIFIIVAILIVAFCPAAYAPPPAGHSAASKSKPKPPGFDSNQFLDKPRSADRPYQNDLKNYFLYHDAKAHSKLSEGAQHALENSHVTELLDPRLPGLRVRVPENPELKKEVLEYSWYQYASKFFWPLTPDDVKIISLVGDPATRNAFDQQIPDGSKAQNSELAKILTGKSNLGKEALPHALKPFSYKFVLVIGHINQKGAFEAINDEGQFISTPLDSLSDAAKQENVNLFPLGCMSAKFSSIGVGHKLNSLKVISNLSNYFSHANKDSTIFNLFQCITSPDLKLEIDPLSFKIYLINQNGYTVAVLYFPPPQTFKAVDIAKLDNSYLPPWVSKKMDNYAKAYGLGILSLIGTLLFSFILGFFEPMLADWGEDFGIEVLCWLIGHIMLGIFLVGIAIICSSQKAGIGFPLILLLGSLVLLVFSWIFRRDLDAEEFPAKFLLLRFLAMLIASLLLLRAKLML